jgi:hypothetical protein
VAYKLTNGQSLLSVTPVKLDSLFKEQKKLASPKYKPKSPYLPTIIRISFTVLIIVVSITLLKLGIKNYYKEREQNV